jgi:glycosyltransferase involved in cell wall biosynthesis
MTSAADRITAVVLTFNEAVHIERCLTGLASVADRVVVVDSFSSDGTVEIARAHGAEVLQNPFVNHAAQFQWGVDQAGIAAGWILRIDADEYLEDALATEIRERLPSLDADVGAIAMRRKVFFQGQWIRWGGYYPTVLTRLWRVGAASIEQRWMDEHVLVRHGRTLLFKRGDLVDDNLKDLTDWTAKHNSYATRQAVEFLSMQFPLLPNRNSGALNTGARFKRLLRNGIYARAPLFLRVFLYQFQRYVLRLGFLDGRKGLVFHTLQGFWNFFLVDAKIAESRDYIRRHGLAAFRQHLAERHGVTLPEDDANRQIS